MRALILAVVAMTASAALADDVDDAHRRALAGRDSYWNCLAQEYTRDSNRSMSGQDFTLHIAGVCPSERQNFRVMLVDYLTMQSPCCRCGSTYDDGQQRHRIGAEGYRDGLYQAQRSAEVAIPKLSVLARSLGRCRGNQEISRWTRKK